MFAAGGGSCVCEVIEGWDANKREIVQIKTSGTFVKKENKGPISIHKLREERGKVLSCSKCCKVKRMQSKPGIKVLSYIFCIP